MRYIKTLIICAIALNVNAQIQEAPQIADPFERTIQEFRKPIGEQDYSKIVAILEGLKTDSPNDTEIRYFLGYAYDLLNSNGGKTIPEMQRRFSELASAEFEFIIKKEPKYSKRKIVLDPYSKLTSIWGSLALKYYYQGNMDSTKFALKEGKKRGGFSDALLEIGEKILNSCTRNSILIASGDNFTFPILYQQMIHNLRTDVQVLDISLLNTDWYCKLIQNTSSNSLLKDSIDMLNIPESVESKKQKISIPNKKCPGENEFVWDIDRLWSDKYITKSDSILKRIVTQNKFLQDIYFTVGQNPNDILALHKYLKGGIFVNKLGACKSHAAVDTENIQFKSITDPSIKNSEDLLFIFDIFRFSYTLKISGKIDQADYEASRKLLNEMERIFPQELIPIQNQRLLFSIADLKIKSGY